ncbi:MAG: prenyltransferase, partial [Candidatus Eremiobacteraeota bacterium]|nr:prenyltransferase [Candidatus Eremiobacteraeota bacterium]
MRTLEALIAVSRLKFLVGGVLGVALGTLAARHQGFVVLWPAWAIAQGVVTSFQLMTHYSNEYFDQACDALATRTPFSGGSGVLHARLLHERTVLFLAIAMLGCGMVFATLGFRFGTLAPMIAVLIAFLAWFYSAPPLRFHSRALGEVNTAIVVGLLVPALAYAMQTRTFSL